MSLFSCSSNKLAAASLRGPIGAFILNSGIGKMGLKGEAAEGLQNFAATGVPAMKKMSPDTFAKFISGSEIGIGAALLCPLVPNKLAGVALATFGSGLLTMYFKNEGMTEKDGIRPTQDGMTLAKDSWLVAAGLALAFMGDKK
ncbi:hypothetical protein [Corynebacterium caspium]|uniref:hypothetical protein n=1 Tax=Corynebacterium caspium TaxID=234828 RepID=UPI00035D32E0|nr:hypothetical protein [Corynebacterium caspium]WKD58488.1 hypothetical protein CCASP_00260 [Corynebacterium caspium DSM 44850]